MLRFLLDIKRNKTTAFGEREECYDFILTESLTRKIWLTCVYNKNKECAIVVFQQLTPEALPYWAIQGTCRQNMSFIGAKNLWMG